MRIATFLIGLSVFVLDLTSKSWVKQSVPLHNFPVIDGFFKLQYVRNTGIAFGLFDKYDSEWKALILGLVAIIAVAIVTYYILRTPSTEKMLHAAMGLLLGGILGNLVDRMLHGYVFDFLTLHYHDKFSWPTFNVADAAITTAVTLILIKTFTESKSTGVGTALMIPVLGLPGPVNMSTDQLVTQLQMKYEEITTLEAKFDQRFASHGVEFSESGYLIMKRPGKMYWEYTQPTQKYFVADGKKTYFYVPEENQVLVSELDLESTDSPLLFLLGKGNLKRDFFVTEEISDTQKHGSTTLRLTPKEPHPEFSYLVIEVSNRDFLIHRLRVVEPIGQENEYRLSDLRVNVKIPDRKFKLNVPSHVEVIEQ